MVASRIVHSFACAASPSWVRGMKMLTADIIDCCLGARVPSTVRLPVLPASPQPPPSALPGCVEEIVTRTPRTASVVMVSNVVSLGLIAISRVPANARNCVPNAIR